MGGWWGGGDVGERERERERESIVCVYEMPSPQQKRAITNRHIPVVNRRIFFFKKILL